MFATLEEAHEQFLATTLARFEFVVRDAWDNGEFLTGATVDIFARGVLVGTEVFLGSSEEPGPDAMTQAISFGSTWVEAEERFELADRLGVHPLELVEDWD